MLYNDVISYSFLDKSFDERINIVNEVNPNATNRAILMNIRDYSGSSLLEEDKTALYYGIRTIQNYMADGKISTSDLDRLSRELREAIMQTKEINKVDFQNSDFTIFDQLADKSISTEIWSDTIELTELGHYSVDKATSIWASELNAYISPISSDQQERLLSKFNPMNTSLEKIFRQKYSIDNDEIIK